MPKSQPITREDYLERAREAALLAERSNDASARTAFVRLAEMWEHLARIADHTALIDSMNSARTRTQD